jgi:hypothetical protein
MAEPVLIQRSPDHRYRLATPAGQVLAGWVPGVTTILGAVARPALDRWRRSETARLAVAERDTLATMAEAMGEADAARWLAGRTERIAADAAARGGGVHAHLEALGRGQDPGPPSAEAAPFVAAWTAWREAWGVVPMSAPPASRPRIAGVEVPVFSAPDRYGGSADAILADPSGELWMVDYKTRSKPDAVGVYESEILQVTALAHADLAAPAGLESEAQPMPAITRGAVLLLRPDGSWRFIPVRIGQPEWVAWTATRALYEWLNGDAGNAAGAATEGRTQPAAVAA